VAAGLSPLPRTAWLEIDLDALTANLAAVRAAVPPGVRVEPVVKADAYGHGSVPVARALEAAGADGLCVATLDEALDLRANGIDGPILVLYPIPPSLAPRAADARLAVTAGDPVLLTRQLEAVASAGPAEPLAIYLEVETGLGRGGFPPDGIVAAAQAIDHGPGVRLAGIWSHLQDPGAADRTAAQVERFREASDRLAAAGVSVPARHIAASGALVLGNAPADEAVRPGLVIYGLAPDDIGDFESPLADALRPVLALHARPVRVAELPVGQGVSYGPSFTTSRPSRIATLPLGYGDGWPRALSNRAEALVRGRRVPLVGTVAMDAIMADVTDVPGPPVGIDDEFTLLGEDGAERITAIDLARSRATISWEVVTTMSRRLPRVYHAAAGVAGLRTLAHGETAWHPSGSGTATSVSSRSTRS
jgi:alanine racemase